MNTTGNNAGAAASAFIAAATPKASGTTVPAAPQYHISGHFMYSDFLCPCCDRIKVVPALYEHVALLERLRNELGAEIAVTSGYRCEAHNREVGGAPRSWHLLFATDVAPVGGDPETLRRMYRIALNLGFGGIGLYEAHLHLDLRPGTVRWRG